MTSNPRHPHHCTIYRISGADAFSEGIKTVVYEGVCRKYHRSSSNALTLDTGLRLQYMLSLPGQVAVKAGDELEVSDFGTEFYGKVTEVEITNLGTTIYWEDYER